MLKTANEDPEGTARRLLARCLWFARLRACSTNQSNARPRDPLALMCCRDFSTLGARCKLPNGTKRKFRRLNFRLVPLGYSACAQMPYAWMKPFASQGTKDARIEDSGEFGFCGNRGWLESSFMLTAIEATCDRCRWKMALATNFQTLRQSTNSMGCDVSLLESQDDN